MKELSGYQIVCLVYENYYGGYLDEDKLEQIKYLDFYNKNCKIENYFKSKTNCDDFVGEVIIRYGLDKKLCDKIEFSNGVRFLVYAGINGASVTFVSQNQEDLLLVVDLSDTVLKPGICNRYVKNLGLLFTDTKIEEDLLRFEGCKINRTCFSIIANSDDRLRCTIEFITGNQRECFAVDCYNVIFAEGHS